MTDVNSFDIGIALQSVAEYGSDRAADALIASGWERRRATTAVAAAAPLVRLRTSRPALTATR